MLSLRDRLLTNTRFQLWARRNPLTRGIARRRATALFDLCAGFVYSQVLLACVRLRVLDLLAGGTCRVDAMAATLGLTHEALLTLIHAAVAVQLLEWRVYEIECGLGRHGAALLGNPGLIPMIEHHALFYDDLRDPVALLRSSAPPSHLESFWAYASAARAPLAAATQQVSAYTALMSASQPFIAAEVLDVYDLRRHRSLLDVGGGDGTFCVAAANRAPRLRVRCFDLPAVAALAQVRFEREKLGSRAEVCGGDFLSGSLPTGSDIVSLVRVLHDHDDAAALRILQAVRLALPPCGTVLIAEPLAGAPGGERVADAYFGLYLLAMGSGKPRTFPALVRLLEAAGFERARLRPMRLPIAARVVVAVARK